MESRHQGRSGVTLGVANVFTEPRYRGQGYATELLSRIIDRARRETPDLHSVILNSEVGSAIYERIGFQGLTSYERMIHSNAGQSLSHRQVDDLYPEDLERHWTPLFGRWSGAQFEILASPALIDWHLVRQEFYRRETGQAAPESCGAVLENDAILWAADLKFGSLRVLLLQANVPARVSLLLSRAAYQARLAGLRDVRIYESDEFRLWRQISIPTVRRRRDDCLPMILPIAPMLRAEDWKHRIRAFWL